MRVHILHQHAVAGTESTIDRGLMFECLAAGGLLTFMRGEHLLGGFNGDEITIAGHAGFTKRVLCCGLPIVAARFIQRGIFMRFVVDVRPLLGLRMAGFVRIAMRLAIGLVGAFLVALQNTFVHLAGIIFSLKLSRFGGGGVDDVLRCLTLRHALTRLISGVLLFHRVESVADIP